jgi:AraC-like DNA-binding protein
VTIAGEEAIQLLACFEALGIRSEDLCRRLGLARSSLAAPGTRLSRVLFDTIFLSAAELQHDPLIGLHAGMAKSPADLLFFVSMSQANVGEALREWARLSRAADDSMAARVVVRGGAAWLRVTGSTATNTDALRHLFEYFAGQVLQYLTLATGAACRPTEVRFPHPPAGPTADYERILGVPVTFRHEAFELRLRAGDLQMPVVTANPDIARLMREAAEQQLRAMDSSSFRARVELALHRLIRETTDHSREGVAGVLATSASTLKRRLREEGCSFRDVRDDVHRAVAEDLLARGEKSLGDIAALLDFADAAAFGKAFRRWTGASPRDFRTRNRHG